jgi:hypothetical protein
MKFSPRFTLNHVSARPSANSRTGKARTPASSGARSRSAASKRAVSRTTPRARPAGIATSTPLPRQRRSRFHGDRTNRNTAESIWRVTSKRRRFHQLNHPLSMLQFLLAAIMVVGPAARKVQSPVDQRVPTRGRIRTAAVLIAWCTWQHLGVRRPPASVGRRAPSTRGSLTGPAAGAAPWQPVRR